MKKTYRIILKISKYLLIIFLSLSVIASLSFIFLSRKLDYKLPTHTSYDVYDRNGEFFFTITNGNKQSYVTLEEVDNDLINAFISIEDKRFFKHKGVDFIRIGGAIIANIEAKYLKEGASTITQQYVKNLYLTQDKELSRKIQEVMIAINIERNYTKNEILEGYLNSIYFGHGIYGVSDASEFYFKKRCDNLTLSECAILAAIPKGPSLYSPILNPEKNLERKNLILKEMYQDEVIKENEYIKALDEKTKIYGEVDNTDNSQYYQDIIVSQVSKMDFLSGYNNSKINIYTSIDRNLTNIVSEAIDLYYPYNESIELSVFAINPYTKEVLCCIGGKDYSLSTYNRATKALRQPGSTIKPFLYYTALENGFTPITTIYSGKTQFNLDGEIYAPNNFGNIYPDSDITMAYALATSDNIYALKTHLFLGTDQLTNTLKKLNFTTPINNNVSLCLG
ncbi:MAG: transglycosylase domain-containing protein, partial [Bacilli bacterium]